MTYDLEQFSAACQRILTADPGPAGREKVCALVQEEVDQLSRAGKELPPARTRPMREAVPA